MSRLPANRSFFSGIALSVALASALLAAQAAESGGGNRSLRLELEGVGAVVARPAAIDADADAAQLLIEKQGGHLHVLSTFEGLEFASLLRADLDNDGFPEVIAIARHHAGDDLMPFIYGGSPDIHRIFPPGEGEDNPVIGRDISVVQGKNGPELCVKIPVTIHDFGPPDLFQIEFYRLQGKNLVKCGESLTEATHFNQIMNRGGLAAQRGRYLDALKDYETVLGMSGMPMRLPPEAKAEALVAAAECRAGLKDFKTALELYRRVTVECSDSDLSEKAGRESALISRHIDSPAALSIYMDIVRSIQADRWSEALSLIDKCPAELKTRLGDYLLFQRGEVLIGLGRIDEAVEVFKRIRTEFRESTLAETALERIQELEGAPETPDAQ